MAMGEPFSWIIRYLALAGIFSLVPLICGPVMIHWKSCETRNSIMRCVFATLTLSKASSKASRCGAPGTAAPASRCLMASAASHWQASNLSISS